MKTRLTRVCDYGIRTMALSRARGVLNEGGGGRFHAKFYVTTGFNVWPFCPSEK